MRYGHAGVCRNIERPARQVHSPAAREEAFRLRCDGSHAVHKSRAHTSILRALPFCEPRTGDRSPIRTKAQMSMLAAGVDWRTLTSMRELAFRLNRAQRACRFDLLTHQITDSLVRGEEIVIATIQCRADA